MQRLAEHPWVLGNGYEMPKLYGHPWVLEGCLYVCRMSKFHYHPWMMGSILGMQTLAEHPWVLGDACMSMGCQNSMVAHGCWRDAYDTYGVQRVGRAPMGAGECLWDAEAPRPSMGAVGHPSGTAAAIPFAPIPSILPVPP